LLNAHIVNQNDAEILRERALSQLPLWIGTPYIWGGVSRDGGIDCSGFAIEILKSVGVLAHSFDTTAAGLFEHFKQTKVGWPVRGGLVFFGRDNVISHVEFIYETKPFPLMIGSSGGNAQTLNKQEASKRAAFVKMRPIASRSDVLHYVDPFLLVK